MVKTQPATMNWSIMVATGMPLTSTRGQPGTTVTGPPWVQVIAAPTWTTGPLM